MEIDTKINRGLNLSLLLSGHENNMEMYLTACRRFDILRAKILYFNFTVRICKKMSGLTFVPAASRYCDAVYYVE